jgi:hypothetical protein
LSLLIQQWSFQGFRFCRKYYKDNFQHFAEIAFNTPRMKMKIQMKPI